MIVRVALLLILAAGTARADDHSYKAEVGISDGAGAVVLLLARVVPDGAATDPLIGFGVATCILAAPIVHASHANYERAGASLAAHVLIPAIGLGIGAKNGSSLDDAIDDALVGALVGHLIASAIDIGLAYRGTDPNALRVISVGGSF